MALVLSFVPGVEGRFILGTAVVDLFEQRGEKVRVAILADEDIPVYRWQLAIDIIREALQENLSPEERSELQVALLVLENPESSTAEFTAVLSKLAVVEVLCGKSVQGPSVELIRFLVSQALGFIDVPQERDELEAALQTLSDPESEWSQIEAALSKPALVNLLWTVPATETVAAA